MLSEEEMMEFRQRRGSGAQADDVPSTGTDEAERASFSDPLPVRSHALDPSVPDTQESREQAPPSPAWLEGARSEEDGPG